MISNLFNILSKPETAFALTGLGYMALENGNVLQNPWAAATALGTVISGGMIAYKYFKPEDRDSGPD